MPGPGSAHPLAARDPGSWWSSHCTEVALATSNHESRSARLRRKSESDSRCSGEPGLVTVFKFPATVWQVQSQTVRACPFAPAAGHAYIYNQERNLFNLKRRKNGS
jgi:hypothetical protein